METGTPLGDPIEVAALTKVFRAGSERAGYCAIGTAKGNVGHLDSAAGVTGVIKTALSMQHRTLPGLAHFEAPNPNIDMAGSPFVFRGKTSAWMADGPLRAGVSAFGVGGVNAHLVMEEAPQQGGLGLRAQANRWCASPVAPKRPRRPRQPIWRPTFAGHPEASLADAAFTLACGRKAHEYRAAIAVQDAADAAAKLSAVKVRQSAQHTAAFQFSGQGTQYVGMGRELYACEPVYKAVVDEAADLLRSELGLDLRELMYAAEDDLCAAATLERTEFAQPALYVTELALVELWKSWGITPSVMVGHSLGEYVAATVAGVMSRRRRAAAGGAARTYDAGVGAGCDAVRAARRG